MSVGYRKFLLFVLALAGSWIAGLTVPPTWMVERVALDALADDSGQLYYQVQGESVPFDHVPMAQAQLDPERVAGSTVEPPIREEYVSVEETVDGETRTVYYRLNAVFHFGWFVAAPGGGGGPAVLGDPRAHHRTAGRGGLRCVPPGQVRSDRRGADPVVRHHQFSQHSGALPVAARRADGRLVAHRRGPGLRRIRHGAVRARTALRQAGGLVAGRGVLPGRHREHGAGGYDGQAHCGPGTRQPRGAGLCRRFHRVADRLATRLQRLAGLRAGLHLRFRRELPGHRVGPHRLLLPERALLLLRDLCGPGHLSAQQSKSPCFWAGNSRKPWRGRGRPARSMRRTRRHWPQRSCRAATCRKATSRTSWSSSCRWGR